MLWYFNSSAFIADVNASGLAGIYHPEGEYGHSIHTAFSPYGSQRSRWVLIPFFSLTRITFEALA